MFYVKFNCLSACNLFTWILLLFKSVSFRNAYSLLNDGGIYNKVYRLVIFSKDRVIYLFLCLVSYLLTLICKYITNYIQ